MSFATGAGIGIGIICHTLADHVTYIHTILHGSHLRKNKKSGTSKSYNVKIKNFITDECL